MMHRRSFCNAGLAAMCGVSVCTSSDAAGLFSSLRRKPRCGVRNADVLGNKSKWGKNNLRYYILGRDHRDLPRQVWDQEFRLAFDSWSDIIPVTFERTIRQRHADIIISVGNRLKESFGVKGGVLAWAEMPSNNHYNGTLLTKFDLAERWVLPEDWIYGTVLRTVAAHEIGHLLGLDHSNDEEALMYPYINNALKPREDDIGKIQELYGKKE